MAQAAQTIRWPYVALAVVALVLFIGIIATNQANSRDRLASGAMRLGGFAPSLPTVSDTVPVRADLPEFATTVDLPPLEKVEPLPLDLSVNALEKQRATMRHGPCSDWRKCVQGFPNVER